VVAGCGAPREPAAQTVCDSIDGSTTQALAPVVIPPPKATEDLDPAERKTLFAELVSRVHEIHVFSKHTKENLGIDWDKDEAPALEKEFDAADTKDKLQVALTHFVNSLHDMHCRYRPPSRGSVVRLRFKVRPEWKAAVDGRAAGPEFYVTEVFDKTLKIEPGDIVESIDGVASGQLLRANRNVTSMNNWPQIALGVARTLTYRRTSEWLTRDGDATRWVLRSRSTGDVKTLDLTWKEKKDENLPDDSWVDYANADCGQTDPATYEGYTLAGRGAHYCLYVANKAPRAFYPIVRQVSFHYFEEEGPQVFLADHDSLALRLSLVKNAKGVILDMRDNGGGNDPNSFVDWWAPARPYTDTFTVMRRTKLVPDTKALDELVQNTPDAVMGFYEACLKAAPKAPAGFCQRRPFMCKPKSCDWDNKFTPSHQVTKLPVALVTGPGCGSSCDAFALTWKRNKFGPIVGMPSMAGFTTNRYRAPIPARIPLGTFDLAFSYDVTDDGEEVEGKAIEPDVRVPETWENHAHYDTAIADAAIAALSRSESPHSEGNRRQ
jgi:C-terminal processing protease CtpA/Prc